jgi:hypothetical protein
MVQGKADVKHLVLERMCRQNYWHHYQHAALRHALRKQARASMVAHPLAGLAPICHYATSSMLRHAAAGAAQASRVDWLSSR